MGAVAATHACMLHPVVPETAGVVPRAAVHQHARLRAHAAEKFANVLRLPENAHDRTASHSCEALPRALKIVQDQSSVASQLLAPFVCVLNAGCEHMRVCAPADMMLVRTHVSRSFTVRCPHMVFHNWHTCMPRIHRKIISMELHCSVLPTADARRPTLGTIRAKGDQGDMQSHRDNTHMVHLCLGA